MPLSAPECNYASPPDSSPFQTDFLISLGILSLLFALYGTAVLYQYISKKGWPFYRLISFMVGVTILAIATSSAMMEYGHASFKGHMIQHLLIGMFAPIALVMGAPVTLALRTLPVKKSRQVIRVFRIRFFHSLSNPVTAAVLNIGTMFLLYLTPLYNNISSKPELHHLVHLHFLLAGYLFVWSMIGPDPAHGRPGLKFRLIVLFFSIAAHTYLSKLMYAHVFPRNSVYTDTDIRNGAEFMYYGGDVAELIVLVFLFAIWYQKKFYI